MTTVRVGAPVGSSAAAVIRIGAPTGGGTVAVIPDTGVSLYVDGAWHRAELWIDVPD